MAGDEIEYLVKLVDARTGEETEPMPGPSAFEAGRRAAEAIGDDHGELEIKGLVLSSDEMREFTADEEAEARRGVEGG